MSSVWYPARQPSNSETFWAPRFRASSRAASTAPDVPESTKPEGNNRFPILHTPPSSAACASSQSSSTSSSPRPITETIFWPPAPVASAASLMSSPRNFARRTPSSKPKQPAAHSAASSPQERPAAAAASPLALPSWSRSHSSPHMLATKMAGWHTSSWCSFSSGPISVTSKRSYPRISLAFWIIGHALACSSAQPIMPSLCEPCPAKRSANEGGRSCSMFFT
mmetsp:Transcript_86916/g.235534  ORF Transcript_86916/g.235534 Transcript_86916/m.235534 type:complete len:223 (-) Transcript_86916:540-1208(-)